MVASVGVRFQIDWQNSISKNSTNIYIERLKDPPPILHANYQGKAGFTPKNPYDFAIFRIPCFFPMELKSTKQKSVSFSEKIIKGHQIKSLQKASNIEGVHAGFIFNFRELSEGRGERKVKLEPETWWVEINDFIGFVDLGERKSIGIDDCRILGIKVEQVKLRTRWKYNIDKLLTDIVERQGGYMNADSNCKHI